MNRPIILDNIVVRSGGNDKTYEYDYSKDINVVKKENLSIPFIDFANNALELETKTRVRSESDDETFNNILELETKTFVERERDDEDDISYN